MREVEDDVVIATDRGTRRARANALGCTIIVFLSDYDIVGMLCERRCRCRTKVLMDDGGIGAMI